MPDVLRVRVALATMALALIASFPLTTSGPRPEPSPVRAASSGGLIRSVSPGGEVSIVPFAFSGSRESSQQAAGSGEPYVRRRLLVGFVPEADRRQRRVVLRSIGARSHRRPPLTTFMVVELPRSVSVAGARAALERSSVVAYAEPDFLYEAATVPNDPSFSNLWALHNHGQAVGGFVGVEDADIDAPETWAVTTGSAEATVAVVDTGIAHDHPDLAPNMWTNEVEIPANGADDDDNGYVDDYRGWDFVADDTDARDLHGHGTHVAGTIAAVDNNDVGIAGVAGGTRIMPLRVLGIDGVGTTSDIAAAFAYAADNGARIVNASLGGPGMSQALLDVIEAERDTLFVVAAGNESKDNDSAPSYPCSYPVANVVCVAATGLRDELSSFSNFGASSVDLAAPGQTILSTVPAFASALVDRFETGISSWTTGGSGSSWGREEDAFGGFVADSVAGTYPPNSNSWIRTTNPVVMNDVTGCALSYVLRLDVEEGKDGLYIEESDLGTQWQTVASWTGSTGGEWIRLTHALAERSDGTLIRFRLESDGTGGSYGGADVDDVVVRCVSTSYSDQNYSYYSGTSMAAPHVAGAAALLWGVRPDVEVSAIREALLGGVDPLGSLAGRTMTAGRLNMFGGLSLLVPVVQSSPQSPVGVSPLASYPALHSESPTATPSVSPTPEATASPRATEAPVAGRDVTLYLRKHLRARGRISSDQQACTTNVWLIIRRNGERIARAQTDAEGAYFLRLPDRTGRYRASLRGFQNPNGDRCAAAFSVVRRHRH